MSLERCPECGGTWSSDSDMCPHCGHKRDCSGCLHHDIDNDGHYYCTRGHRNLYRCGEYEYDDTEKD